MVQKILGDEGKRKQYDRGFAVRGFQNPNGQAPKTGTNPTRRNVRYQENPFNNRAYDYQWRYEFTYDDGSKREAKTGTRRFHKTFDFFGMVNNTFSSMMKDFPQYVDESDRIAGDVCKLIMQHGFVDCISRNIIF